MEHDDLVWLSGLLEGEGTFDLHGGRYPRVRLAMTDRDIVERAAALLGVRVRLSLRTPPSLPLWCAELSGERAAGVLEVLLPHMGSRRSGKIAAVLAAYRMRAAADRSSIPGPRLSRS